MMSPYWMECLSKDYTHRPDIVYDYSGAGVKMHHCRRWRTKPPTFLQTLQEASTNLIHVATRKTTKKLVNCQYPQQGERGIFIDISRSARMTHAHIDELDEISVVYNHSNVILQEIIHTLPNSGSTSSIDNATYCIVYSRPIEWQYVRWFQIVYYRKSSMHGMKIWRCDRYDQHDFANCNSRIVIVHPHWRCHKKPTMWKSATFQSGHRSGLPKVTTNPPPEKKNWMNGMSSRIVLQSRETMQVQVELQHNS